MNDGLKKALSGMIVGILAMFGILVAITGYNFYMEYIQIREIGQNFVSVFSKNLTTKIAVQGISFLIVFLLIL